MIYISISSTGRCIKDKERLYGSVAKILPVIIQINKMISSVNHEPTVKANFVFLVGDRVKMEVRDV